MNFSYHSHTQQSIVKSFIPRSKQISYSLKWALDEYCYFHKCYTVLDITLFKNSFSAERDYECQILRAESYLLSDTETTR